MIPSTRCVAAKRNVPVASDVRSNRERTAIDRRARLHVARVARHGRAPERGVADLGLIREPAARPEAHLGVARRAPGHGESCGGLGRARRRRYDRRRADGVAGPTGREPVHAAHDARVARRRGQRSELERRHADDLVQVLRAEREVARLVREVSGVDADAGGRGLFVEQPLDRNHLARLTRQRPHQAQLRAAALRFGRILEGRMPVFDRDLVLGARKQRDLGGWPGQAAHPANAANRFDTTGVPGDRAAVGIGLADVVRAEVVLVAGPADRCASPADVVRADVGVHLRRFLDHEHGLTVDVDRDRAVRIGRECVLARYRRHDLSVEARRERVLHRQAEGWRRTAGPDVIDRADRRPDRVTGKVEVRVVRAEDAVPAALPTRVESAGQIAPTRSPVP